MQVVIKLIAIAGCICAAFITLAAQTCNEYRAIVEREYTALIQMAESEYADWQATYNAARGFEIPSQMVRAAAVSALLYEQGGDKAYLQAARGWLLRMCDVHQALPRSIADSLPEFRNGIPCISNFFDLPLYCRTYYIVRKSNSLTATEQQRIENCLEESIKYMVVFPEWGPMNRSIMKAVGFLYGALAMPQHPEAETWRKLGQTLALDNIGAWTMEDARLYQAIWLYYVLLYAEAEGDTQLYRHPLIAYYFEYFLRLTTPRGLPPAFGDSRDESARYFLIACYEWAARHYNNPEFKWAADRVLQRTLTTHVGYMDLYSAIMLLDATAWCSDDVQAQEPTARSQEVLEDLFGKKIVLRSGYDSTAAFLMLNYRDEGDFAVQARNYMRNTIPVEEEKVAHGHSDENAVISLMQGQSVLLHSAGYRSDIPSGPWGAYRADYFQNRLVVRNRKRDRKQALFEFLRDAGTYHAVETEKIDFLQFQNLDYSRTRLRDPERGYEWDRVITWIRDDNIYVVTDIVHFLRDDFYTLANLWHVGDIVEQGSHHYRSQVDSIGRLDAKGRYQLALSFPETKTKRDSILLLDRWHRESAAIYQTVSSHYRAGTYETFVTILQPIARTHPTAQATRVETITVADNTPGIALRYRSAGSEHILCIKTDLNHGLLTSNKRPRYTFATAKLECGPLVTDAAFAYVRTKERTVQYSAAVLSRLDFEGTTLFESAESSFSIQPDDLSNGSGTSLWRAWEGHVDR